MILAENSRKEKTIFINKCLEQYEEKLSQEGEFSDCSSDDQKQNPDYIINEKESFKYYGYQDKKSITIKPIRMHKDLISLKKENQQKKKIIAELQKNNVELKNNYQKSMNENKKVQKFLKDIQFTFKNDRKAQKANEIMLKAKRMLYREAVECQNNAKKITKSAQANTVQQAKMYIEFLQAQKLRLKNVIQQKKTQNQRKRQEQDFNAKNEQKFEKTLQRVEKMLNIQMQRTKRHHEIYKIQKSMVSTGLKQKQIMLKKKSIEKYYDKLKDLLLKKQGEQYEIIVLEKKRKDKIKLIDEMKQFKNDIKFKNTSIQQFQKDLKQKLKTYDYMSKWTKQLKVKLQEKKQSHVGNKIAFEKKINALSRQFQEWNKKYKLELVEEQFGILNTYNSNGINSRKKGNTAKQIYFGNAKDLNRQGTQPNYNGTINKRLRLIRIEEITKIVKKIKLWVMENQINLEQFIKQKILKWTQSKEDQTENNRKLSFGNQGTTLNKKVLLEPKEKNIIKNIAIFNLQRQSQMGCTEKLNQPSAQANLPKISLNELYQNIKSELLILNQQSEADIMKMARYVIQGNGTAQNINGCTNIKTSEGIVPNLVINKKLALTILHKLFQSQLKTREDVQKAKHKFREFLIKNYDPFRYDILKMLLHMDGLKDLHKIKLNPDGLSVKANGQISNINPGDEQTSNIRNTNTMNSMKKNQQLHLQLELDENILMVKLTKHVVQQFYVARYKELIDFMIYQQFGQIQRPRLGMLDRVCEIVTDKKLIKEIITRDYNFDAIIDMEESLAKGKCKQSGRRQQQIVLTQKSEEQSFWIIPKNDKQSKCISDDKQVFDEARQDSKKRTWLNDLMSDQDSDQSSSSQDYH